MQRQLKGQTQCQTCGENIPQCNYPIHAVRCSMKKQSKLQLQKSSILSSQIKREKPKGLSRVRKNKIFQEQSYLKNYNEQKIPCSYCGYMQSFSELDTHPGKCEGRQSICEYCGDMYPDQLMEQHENLCPANSSHNISYSESDQQQNHYESNRQQPINRLMNIIQLIDNMRILFRNLDIQQDEPGLHKDKLQKLKKFKYKQSKEDQLCTICYCKMQTGEQCIELKCKHIYHTQCISKWLQQSSKCPVCKHDQNYQKSK